MNATGNTVMEADTTRGAGSPWRRFTARSRWVVAIAAVAVAAIGGSLAFWLAGGGASGPQSATVRGGEVWLQGQITDDGCDSAQAQLPIGDVGCSITVNGYQVLVVNGNARLPGTPGTVTGLNVSANQSGSHADVYAQLTGSHSASILTAAKYYARIS
jgi:hypothetical protein